MEINQVSSFTYIYIYIKPLDSEDSKLRKTHNIHEEVWRWAEGERRKGEGEFIYVYIFI